ncbi:MAG: BON domain-containing protein [Burkholderiales bacterium]
MRCSQVILCAMLATLMVSCANTDTGENIPVYASDATLIAKIKTRLSEDKSVSRLAINVEANQGIVRLSGFAKTAAERQRAVNLTRSIKGVVAVKNDIQLQ